MGALKQVAQRLSTFRIRRIKLGRPTKILDRLIQVPHFPLRLRTQFIRGGFTRVHLDDCAEIVDGLGKLS